MSIIGNNIKKIRSVKKLNQQAFADMFNIKRASVGAYEEGRADPKIKTIVDIANKFGISLDLFITKELKVNDLYRFDLFREDLTGGAKHNLNPQSLPVELIPVPWVNKDGLHTYLNEEDDKLRVASLSALQLPLAKGKDYRAFDVNDHLMQTGNGGLMEGDIFIGECPKGFDVSQVEPGKVYLFETKSGYSIRKVIAKNMSQIKLIGENDQAYPENLNLKEIQKVWQGIRVITKNISSADFVTSELKNVREELRVLKLKIK